MSLLWQAGSYEERLFQVSERSKPWNRGKGSSSVRQVDEIPEGSNDDNTASTSSSAFRPAASNGGGKPAVRLVSFANECDREFDLTSYDSHGGSVCMLRDDSSSRADALMFECEMNCCSFHHVICESLLIFQPLTMMMIGQKHLGSMMTALIIPEW